MGREAFWERRYARRSARLFADELREFAEWLESLLAGPPRMVGASFLVMIEHNGEVGIEMGEVTGVVGQSFTASVQFFDADGNPTVPDQVPTWSSNDTSVATVAASEDGLTATVTAIGLGSSVIECLAVELEPEAEIRATGVVNVQSGDTTPDAVVGEVTFSEPEAAPTE